MEHNSEAKQTDNSVTIDFAVQGMSCSACAARLEKAVGKMEGVEMAAVSFPLRTAWVQYSPGVLGPAQIAERVKQLGFEALLNETAREGLHKEHLALKLRLAVSALLTLPLLTGMLQHIPLLEPLLAAVPAWLTLPWLQLALASIIQFVIGMPFYFGAYHALRQRSANMDVLVAIGTTAAYFYSHYAVFQDGLFRPLSSAAAHAPPLYFETSAVVITAVVLGKYIETKASLRAQQSSNGFNIPQSQLAAVERAGAVVRIQTEFVRAGDIVIVEAGEVIPVDGIVIGGLSAADESLLTGESLPVTKREGDPAWAGTRNESACLRIRTDAAGHDTMINRIQELVRQAQRSKSAIQRNVDAAASWFVPVMLAFALITVILWGVLLDPGNWSRAFVSAIAVLLAACPCALGLAAPISLVIASGRLAKQGIISKEAGALERLAGIQTLIFDKTGTLTEGKPRVSAMLAVKGSRSSLLRLAAAAEAGSSHPLAAAIKREAGKLGLVIPQADQQAFIPGGGVEAVIEGQRFAVGNARFAAERGWKVGKEAAAFAASREAAGETVLYAAVERECNGVIALSDSIKHNARQTVRELKKLGVTALLATGDHESPAQAAAKAAGIIEVHASMLPEQKAALVEKLKNQGKRVAMAGDGWNDAPALATADVGIAMGDGTAAALSAGHMTLLFSRLQVIPEAIRISRLTIRNVRQNLTFAFLYNVIIIPFASFGLLEPWMAGTAMALSSVSVVGNALRLTGQLRRTVGAKS
ncbi:heavy metal translocating P-type ATPase [Paenibacillus alkaliterrae]|uniref:heavy metal translocating P-type ATPase n=1 Tax=Paenibacillus alkaliterrae TaxID=320909 RepID=UPI001F1794C0|nr:heavy metal translocating P-type ATPase [Paenibacillus alkaliterrae]MCF2937107.1 heavy metal translocating P-type ATPase [Paenibacillus alkaliterrae]